MSPQKAVAPPRSSGLARLWEICSNFLFPPTLLKSKACADQTFPGSTQCGPNKVGGGKGDEVLFKR